VEWKAFKEENDLKGKNVLGKPTLILKNFSSSGRLKGK
jgi:hypothetical protein